MTFYRFEDDIYSSLKDKPREVLFSLVRETDCGYWVRSVAWSFEKPRWVSKTAKKRFCYPTRKDALVSYSLRKNRQVALLEHQLSNARHWKNISSKMLQEEKPLENV